MSVLIRDMEMPTSCEDCFCFRHNAEYDYTYCNISSVNVIGHGNARPNNCPLIPVPLHGDLIGRDALMKDGWLNLHKEVMRMGGYAVHELPLINPLIPVIIPADKEGEG